MTNLNVSRRAALRLESLEQRENPAGSISTSHSGGVLIITGSDQADTFTIKSIAGGAYTLTGTNGTLIDGSASANTLAASSIKMILKGGDDSVTADTTVPLTVTGALIIDGGDGNNTVNLTTTASAVTLGSFNYIGGEGLDTISVGQTGTNSAITGAVSLNPGNGGSAFTLTNLLVGGDLIEKAGAGADSLTLTTVTIGKGVSFDAGQGNGTLNATATVINAGLSYNALTGTDTVSLADATVKGKSGITVNSGNGDLNFAAAFTVSVPAGGVTLAGKNGNSIVNFNGGTTSMAGDLRVANKSVASQNSGTVTVANLSYAAGDLLAINGVGIWNVRKNVTLGAHSPIGQINTAAFDELNLDGSLSAVSTKDQTVELNRGLIKGGVSLNSSQGSASLFDTSVGNVDFRQGITVRARQAATVGFDSAGQAKVAGDIVVTSLASTAEFRNSAGEMILSGGVRVSAYSDADLTFTSSSAIGGTIAKDVSVTSLTGGVNVNAGARKLTLAGRLTGSGATDASMGGNSTGTVRFQKDVTLTGGYGNASVVFNGNGDVIFAGKLTVTGGNDATLNWFNNGLLSSLAGDLAVTAKLGRALASFGGAGKLIAGNVQINGEDVTLNVNSTGTQMSFAKILNVLGGAGDATILMLGAYNVAGDTSFNLGDGSAAVILSSAGAGTDFSGKLSIVTGASTDTVTFTNVQAAKDVTVSTGAGNDVLYIDGQSVVGGAFSANTGAGGDTIDLGRGTGFASPAVSFNGKVTINAGSGNDTLFLGKSVGGGGDANSIAVFNVAGSSINGGTGLNEYDDVAGQGLATLNLNLIGF